MQTANGSREVPLLIVYGDHDVDHRRAREHRDDSPSLLDTGSGRPPPVGVCHARWRAVHSARIHAAPWDAMGKDSELAGSTVCAPEQRSEPEPYGCLRRSLESSAVAPWSRSVPASLVMPSFRTPHRPAHSPPVNFTNDPTKCVTKAATFSGQPQRHVPL